jgi:thioesterase domain-containing protein/acyl carrier protein
MTPSVSDLRGYLKGQVPEYMVPAGFVLLDELPLTPNGKVDRRALAAMPISDVPADDYVAPADEVEAKLAKMWEEILAKKPIGTNENFFELGGHSLAAIRLMRRVEQSFHRKLPLVTLFKAPTVAQLGAILRRDEWSPSKSLIVPIQPLGKRPVFFCVHGMGGSVLRFQDLARHMAPDQPFYGIQPQGIDGGMPFLNTVEEMATVYIREMRQAQPDGPYFIGGYSLGGQIAFEMARQLEADGQEVAFLGLLDTYPGKPKSNAMLLGTLLAMPLAQKLGYVSRRLTRYRKGFRRRYDALFLPPALKEVRRILAQAELAYKPKTYFGSATWLRASEKALRGVDDPQNDWSTWAAGGVEVHEIDGDHGSIMKEPMVGVFAAKLRECLVKAQQKSMANAAAPVAVEVGK